MTDVSISTDPKSIVGFRAISGEFIGSGRTPGEALDRLAEQLDPAEQTWIVVQGGGDEFFTFAQHLRLSELKQRFRKAVDEGDSLSETEQGELNDLINQELEGTSKRARALKLLSAS